VRVGAAQMAAAPPAPHRHVGRLVRVARHVSARTAPVAGTVADYRAALQLLSPEVQAVAMEAEITPHWISSDESSAGSKFWYATTTRAVPKNYSTAAQLEPQPEGAQFVLVDTGGSGEEGGKHPTQAPAFDHARLAASLSQACGQTIDPAALPFRHIRFTTGADSAGTAGRLEFSCHGHSWSCDLDGAYAVCSTGRSRSGARVLPAEEVVSPDSKYAAYIFQHNLWLRDTVTGASFALSTEGEPGCEPGVSILEAVHFD
jgi:dipeptidyl-peptidase-4